MNMRLQMREECGTISVARHYPMILASARSLVPLARYDAVVLAYESGRLPELMESFRASLPILVGCLVFSLALLVASAATGRRDLAMLSLLLPFAVVIGYTIVFWAL
jgi:hypothetical protein